MSDKKTNEGHLKQMREGLRNIFFYLVIYKGLLNAGKFFKTFCRLLFAQNQLFQNILSGIPSTVSKSLDPDQDRQKVGPDLGLNCLQR